MNVKILKSYSLAVIVITAAILGISGCGKNGKMMSITVTPADISVIPGTPLQYQAQGNLSDGTTYFLSIVDWSSSDTTVALIDPTGGFLVASTTTGTVTIAAADPYSTFIGTTSLAVALLSSITVTPTNPSMTPGLTHQFTATGILANSATQDLTTFATCTWTSSDTTVATVVSTPGIGGSGVVTSVAPGTAIIQASVLTSDGTGSSITVTGTTTLTVTSVPLASLAFNPASDLNLTIPLTVSSGTTTMASTHQYDVTGTYSDSTQQPSSDWTSSAIWSSSNPAIATINATGLATAVAFGTTTITAADPITGIAMSSALTVTSP